jgi:HSF-type DNA-binding
MSLMRFAESQGDNFCVTWLEDGKSFVINDPDTFARQVVPKYFKQTKFSSFTRKLYRWGFRQVNRGIGPDDPIIFGNEYFQRDNAEMMAKMRSITAASTRKQDQHHMPDMYSMKRPFDVSMDDSNKRMAFDHFLHQKSAFMQNQAFYGGSMQHGGETMSLTNALYPNMNMGGAQGSNMMASNAKHGYTGNSMMHPYVAHQNMQQSSSSQQQYPNQSTAEIVNAAISALRYAN